MPPRLFWQKSQGTDIVELSKDYPEYGLEKHKGYATKAHMEAIRKYGVQPIHRKTFMTDKVLGINKTN